MILTDNRRNRICSVANGGMNVKINHVGPMGVNPYKRQYDKIENIQKTNPKTTDKVEISSAAKELQGSIQLDNNRQEKVQEIKQQVQNGTYKINHEKIAQGILKFFN